MTASRGPSDPNRPRPGATQRDRATRALSAAFDRLAPELLLLAGHLVSDPGAAEDLVQETFLRALEHAERFDAERAVRPWLHAILLNEARHEWRRRRRRPDRERLPPSGGPDPALEAQARELVAALERALHSLPQHYREVLQLHLQQGMSLAQIADELGRTPATVRTQHRRGLERLRRRLPDGLAVVALLDPDRLRRLRGALMANAATRRRARPRRLRTTLAGAAAAAAVLTALALLVPRTDPAGPARLAAAPAARPRPSEAGSTGPAPPAPPRREVAAPPKVAGATGLTVRVVHGTDRRPLPGIAVRLLEARWLGDLETLDAQTDENGRCVFSAVTPGTCYLASGRGQVVELEPGRWRDRPFVLPVAPGLRLLGQVLDAEGAPVPGAAVRTFGCGLLGLGVAAAHTDRCGRFELRDLAPGVSITASAAGHGSPPLTTVRGQPGETRSLLLRLLPATVVRGHVVDESHRPVAGAWLWLGGSQTAQGVASRVPVTGTSDSDGRFSLEIAPGPPAVLWARASGTGTSRGRIDPRLALPSTLELVLRREAVVRGRVTDPDGAPVAGAVVQGYHLLHEPAPGSTFDGPSMARPTTLSDGGGHFTLRGLRPGRSRLRVDAAGGFAQLECVLEPGGRTWQPVVRRGLTITGSVRDADGGPLADWWVSATGPPGAPQPAAVTSGPDGGFALVGCIDARYQLHLRPPIDGAERGLELQRQVRPGGPPAVFAVADGLLPHCVLCATLLRHDGSPLERADLTLVRRSDLLRLQLSVATPGGALRHDHLLPGRFLVMLATPDGPLVRDVVLTPNAPCDLGRVVTAAPGSLSGTLRSADGRRPLTGRLRVTDPDYRLMQDVDVTDGRFSTTLAPGRYRIVLESAAEGFAYREITVRAGVTQHVDLRALGGVPVRFRVPPTGRVGVAVHYAIHRSDGELVMQSAVHCRNRDHPVAWTACLPPGCYELRVRSPTRPADGIDVPFTVLAGAVPAVVAFPLPAPDQR